MEGAFFGLSNVPIPSGRHLSAPKVQGWAQGSFFEAETEVKAERSRQRRGKSAMSLTEARQGRGREVEAEAGQTKFEARPRRDRVKLTLFVSF